mgnify:CR=1 FL=1
MAKYAINGFGRIGRNVLRAMSKEERNKVVAINDLTPIETIAHLLKYDSTQGKFDGEISIVPSTISFPTLPAPPTALLRW